MAPVGTSLADLDEHHARVAITPFKSVTQLLMEALGRTWGPGPQSPGVDTLRAALEPEDFAALAPIFGVRHGWYLPSCLMPQPAAHIATFGDELDRMATMASTDLVGELDQLDLLDTAWAGVAQVSRRWLDAYIAGLRRAWSAVEPLWRRAIPLLEREVERVGVALARGSFGHVLDGLHPRGHVIDDRWYVACALAEDDTPQPVDVTSDLWLVPTMTAPQAWSLGTDDDTDAIKSVAYALPGLQRLDTRPAARGHPRALDSLLGTPRAEILRRLDRPTGAGVIARDLLLVPSGVSHHLKALERSGLIRRVRMGTRTFVHRTARGTALLHLYSDEE